MKIDKDSMIKILNNRMECARRIRDEYHIGTTLYSLFDGEVQECDELLSFLNTLKEDAEHYFPELSQSEDEKIRKDIIRIFTGESNYTSKEDANKYIAWLEKQGDCSAKWEKNTADNKPTLNHSVLMKNIHGIAEGEWNGKEWIQYRWSSNIKDSDVLYWMNLYELEKHGEQKHINDTDEEIVNAVKDTSVLDMVEPKFKVGDWITDGEAVFHITSYDIDYGYQLETQKGTSFHFSDEKVESKYHLWTIQDAKDGDVLEFVDHERVVIGIVSFVNERTRKVDVSCLLEDNKFTIGNFYALDTINPHPATKEQRDQLEKAMFDAGYKWNKEKLKLEKI